MTNPFATEADLCAAFLTKVPAEWTAYPETAGWDIVLVHAETGVQVGIEAKLTLNTKVLVQAASGRDSRALQGPDFRAVLVGRVVAETAALASILHLTVLVVEREAEPSHWHWSGKGRPWPERFRVHHGSRWNEKFLPDLAAWSQNRRDRNDWYDTEDGWHDEAPINRLALPEYLPRVAAGVSGPRKLTTWTIQAIKLCQFVDRHGQVTAAHFKALKLSASRWCDGIWLEKAANRGTWRPGRAYPGPRFQKEHPEVWAEIEADYEKWGAPLISASGTQGALSL